MSKRIEKSYAEALASLGDPKNIYGALEEIAQILLRNLESRIEWKIQEARTRHQPITLAQEIAELERLGRIHATLQDPRMNEYRTGDPDAGAREIVRILQIARREFGNEKTETTEGGEDVTKEAPENKKDVDKEETKPDKITQNPTVEGADATGIERPPALGHIIAGRGKVRRTSG